MLSILGVRDKIGDLSKYELAIARQLVNPNDIDVTFDDIAGMDEIVEQIRCIIIFPLLTPSLKEKSPFFVAPKGVLLYGPPGCGKTMIAKATAKEANAR